MLKKTTKMRRVYAIAIILVMVVSSLCIFGGSSEASPSFAYVHVEMEDGTPASGANVTLTNTVTGISVYEFTDDDGYCTFNRDVDYFVIPGIQFAAYNQTIKVDVTKDEYTAQEYFHYSWILPTQMAREWVNITLTLENDPIPLTTLLGIGIGIGLLVLVLIVVLFTKSQEKKERAVKKRGKKRRRR